MPISEKPPALVAPAPPAPGAASFQQDFNAAASPAVRAWVNTETAALLAAPLDLKRLARDADSRAAGASDPTTAALVLRLAVELRLQTAFQQRRSTLTAAGPATPPPTSTTSCGLIGATQAMQEQQMAFNLQYLQLQNSLQNDNRQFTMISNIMKTKHDTAKNTISNIH
jgi:hypothetical protein